MTDRRRPPRWTDSRIKDAVARSTPQEGLDNDAGCLSPATLEEAAASLVERARTGIRKEIKRWQ